MTDKTEEITSDVESLGMSLGKRLGRLEVSGEEILEELVGLVERSEVVEEALVEEHVVREKIEDNLKKIGVKVEELEIDVAKTNEEKSKEYDALKTRLAQLEEEQMDYEKNFLQLVESCLGMQVKLKLIEGTNVKLVEEGKDLQKEKDALTCISKSSNSSANPVSSITTTAPLIECPSISTPMTQPPPTLGAIVRRRSLLLQVGTLSELHGKMY